MLAAALLVLSAGRARAVPAFDKESSVVFSSAAPQAFVGNYPNLRMYFLRPSSGTEIGSALSTDGVNWMEDAPAGRLSTGTLPSVSASSITGCGVLPLAGGGFRMLYSIVSSTGAYRIHSATSADGLAWANDAGVRVDNGAAALSSPRIAKLNDGSWRLYYVTIASSKVFTSRSLDEGITWTPPVLAFVGAANEVGPSVLTNGKVRLYYTTAPPGSSSVTVVASALSVDAAGGAFALENGFRISTASASGTLASPVPVRSTDTFRWRLYYDFLDPGVSSTASVHTALTGAPAPVSVAPAAVLNSATTATLTVSGDVFSTPTPAVQLSLAGQILAPTSVTRLDDQTLTVVFNVLNVPTGFWDLTVTNADGRATTLGAALNIDFPGGSVTMINNLLRPRTGTKTTIAVTTFNDGNLLARVYTVDGRPVNTLYNGPKPKGVLALTWDGTDAGGSPVASGVYILRTVAPKIDLKDKIVVIR
jgi:hypothetical protein